MRMKNVKTVNVKGVDISYRESGSGHPVLLVHGIASFSLSWRYLVSEMKGDYRFIALDLKGMGYSSKDSGGGYSPFDQSEILCEFVRSLDLKDFVMVAHSMGGAVALLSLFDPDIASRAGALVLIDSAGMFLKIPDFVAEFMSTAEEAIILKYSDARPAVLPLYILSELYHDPLKIRDETIEEYSKVFSMPYAKECMIASLRQLLIANFADFYRRLGELRIRTLVVWGVEDTVIGIEDAFHFRNAIPNARLKLVRDAGHCPHEEAPAEVAAAIVDFLGNPDTLSADDSLSLEQVKGPGADMEQSLAASAMGQMRKMRMSRLFKGNWTPGGMFFFVVIKFLQLLRNLGFFAMENGWRRITQVFLRKEHSKFCLASFRLNYLDGGEGCKVDFNMAKIFLVSRLFKFLKGNPVFHWRIEPHAFSVTKERHEYVDIVEAEFDSRGKLLRLFPHFESSKEEGVLLSASKSDRLCKIVEDAYNEFSDAGDKRRLTLISRRIRAKIREEFQSVSEQITMRHYGDRILQATMIHFFRTDLADSKCLSSARLATPEFRILKHPGAGLLNIVCRFSHDFAEADLWFQYHHAPVDGMPMQEMLDVLKRQWGECGPVVFPALNAPEAVPELIYAGDGMYRGRIFCDFSKILKLRKRLNDFYYNEMHGPAPLPALLMWGIVHDESFKDFKFCMPVDTATMDVSKERNISLIFIKPRSFLDDRKDLCGLIEFIREFNTQIYMTRVGRSESYEFIEIAGMLQPWLSSLMRRMAPRTFYSILGNAGFTIIKNAEIFITPLTELQNGGFIAVGNCRMRTADGSYAGSISICGEKPLVESYFRALNSATENIESICDCD
ncbi:MAG: alpha/beta hydrolase [Victivallales bacterium]|nr:alpha/beta hydrolase [Victivallales bacterium]